MIIEFAGCTGAGKTTFAVGVIERLRADGFLVQDCCGRGSSGWITARNAAVTPFLMIALLATGGPALTQVRRAWAAIRHRTPAPFWRFARAAATVRLTGTHSRRARDLRGNSSAGIVDEGILTTVTLAFSGHRAASDQEIRAFVDDMLLPDVVVLVDAPLDALLERTLARKDRSRELRRLSEREIRLRLRNAQQVFETLVASPRVAERLIRVWNPPAATVAREAEVDRAASAVGELLRL